MYDLDQTIELLQRAVTEKGDGHRAQCQYQKRDDEGEKTGQPICIVGHVLAYTGLLNQAREGERVFGLPVSITDQFTPAALEALNVAQLEQDDAKTWGEALIAAKEVRPLPLVLP